ncbi:helix-turn-helix domain containing protein [Sporosarcina sp. NPDC096371]|uniref:helix-turn-helix domain containing protein n=1 Tax=Sporosarcina sp. NPDC096371 TaxID=3364530 RepID=UPI00380E8D8F
MIAAQEVKYVLFEDIEVKWVWRESELMRFRLLWNEGVGISEMAKELHCNQRSVALLIMDQAEQGLVKQRPRGVLGQ